jgi:FkbM family methyltransferase
MLADRNPSQILKAIFGTQHYVALMGMLKVYPDFVDNLKRYLTNSGEYPYEIRLRTPTGMVAPKLDSQHDLRTVNEIFCREDYPAHSEIRTVVDIGSNIGISALYFLTRNRVSECYLFEPDERNTARLKSNLAAYEGRYHLAEKAIANKAGMVQFGIESTGRYGGIGVATGRQITVECLEINGVLEKILESHDFIDVLKLDTEGVEISTVEAIKPDLLKRIKRIYMEAEPTKSLHPELFSQKQYGSVCQLTRLGTEAR